MLKWWTSALRQCARTGGILLTGAEHEESRERAIVILPDQGVVDGSFRCLSTVSQWLQLVFVSSFNERMEYLMKTEMLSDDQPAGPERNAVGPTSKQQTACFFQFVRMFWMSAVFSKTYAVGF